MRPIALSLGVALGIGLVAAACGDSPMPPVNECIANPREPGLQEVQTATYDSSLGVDLSLMTELPSGVYIQDVVAGAGATIQDGSIVTVAYTGRLTNGCTFDSGQLQYVHPPGFIEGWVDGTAGQALGATRLIVMPPDLGYGNRADLPPIPPGSVLIFRIEVLALG